MKDTEKAQALLIMPLYTLQYFRLFNVLYYFIWSSQKSGEEKLKSSPLNRQGTQSSKTRNDLSRATCNPWHLFTQGLPLPRQTYKSAHLCLRWQIGRAGTKNQGSLFVAWASSYHLSLLYVPTCVLDCLAQPHSCLLPGASDKHNGCVYTPQGHST